MTEVKFKPLFYFFLAAASLLMTGLIINPVLDPLDWFFLLWSTITGIFITYRFNDFIDQSEGFRFNTSLFFKNNLHKAIALQFLFILLPLSFSHLSSFRFALLGIMFFLGMLYSVNIQIKNFQLRIKHIFLVKNLLIGLCWGALVLIGSNNISENTSLTLFIMASIQVFIGSSIRDLNDIEKDTIEYVSSIPIVLGLKRSLILFHCLNFFALLIPILMISDRKFLVAATLVTLWRLLVLIKVGNNINHLLWSQKMNLMTCSVIFLGTLISWLL